MCVCVGVCGCVCGCVCARARACGSVLLADQALLSTETFTYLDSVVRQDGVIYEDIQSRLSKARNAFRSLNAVWRSSQYSIKTS